MIKYIKPVYVYIYACVYICICIKLCILKYINTKFYIRVQTFGGQMQNNKRLSNIMFNQKLLPIFTRRGG